MAYRQNLVQAAHRHLKAAQRLYDEDGSGAQPGCRAVAGYLFGIAGELAVKELMRDSGMKPLTQGNDPFYAHFPELKRLVLMEVQGRRAGELRKLLENDQLFQYWDIAMRYAPTEDIAAGWVTAWKASAEELVGRI